MTAIRNAMRKKHADMLRELGAEEGLIQDVEKKGMRKKRKVSETLTKVSFFVFSSFFFFQTYPLLILLHILYRRSSKYESWKSSPTPE
jgi:hypothetical protein